MDIQCIIKKRTFIKKKPRMAAFQGMHVLPAKHINVWLPRKCDNQTFSLMDIHINGQTPDKVIPMCRYASQATPVFLTTIEACFHIRIWGCRRRRRWWSRWPWEYIIFGEWTYKHKLLPCKRENPLNIYELQLKFCDTVHLNINGYLRMQKCCYSIYSLWWLYKLFQYSIICLLQLSKGQTDGWNSKDPEYRRSYHLPQNTHIFLKMVWIFYLSVFFSNPDNCMQFVKSTHICLISWICRCNIYTKRWLNYCSNGTK